MRKAKDANYTLARIHPEFKKKLLQIQAILQKYNNEGYLSISDITKTLARIINISEEEGRIILDFNYEVYEK